MRAQVRRLLSRRGIAVATALATVVAGSAVAVGALRLLPGEDAEVVTTAGADPTSPVPIGTPSLGGSASLAPSATTTSPSASPSTTRSGRSTKVTPAGGTILIGGSMSESSANAAPFDAQYSYIHSRPAPTKAAYTAKRCDPAWSGWWGCWTGPTTAPGTQLTVRRNSVAKATYQGKAHPQKILWNWYSLIDVAGMAGYGEGPDEAKVLTRADLLGTYFDDYRFFLKKIGTSHDLIDLEPDFWGFARSLGNLHQVPAQVRTANATDCRSLENSAAGFASCLITMTRTYAPNARVGLHLTCFDWQYNLKKCQNDYRALSAGAGDFMVTDITDRDAGWYAQPAHGSKNTFWTDQKAAAALRFYKAMSETVGKPIMLWQIPVGNMAQNNTPGHYKDDKVDWLFSHLKQVSDAHVSALFFGAGWSEQTTPETDGGNLIRKTIAYRTSGGVRVT